MKAKEREQRSSWRRENRQGVCPCSQAAYGGGVEEGRWEPSANRTVVGLIREAATRGQGATGFGLLELCSYGSWKILGKTENMGKCSHKRIRTVI